MSRSIQVGDFVIVSLLGQSPATYIIRTINENGIYISLDLDPNSLSLVVSDGKGGWTIHGGNLNYVINFQANLTVQPIAIQPTVVQHTFIESAIKDLPILNKAVDIGRLDIMEQYYNKGQFKLEGELLDSARDMAGRRLDVFKWYHSKGIDLGLEPLLVAAQFRHPDIIKWAVEMKLVNLVTGIHIANIAAGANNVEILNILESAGILPENSDRALLMGSIDALNWLYDRKIYPTENAIGYARRAGVVPPDKVSQTMQWLKDKNLIKVQPQPSINF